MALTWPSAPPPTPGFEQAQIQLRSATAQSNSQFNFGDQRFSHGAMKWQGSLTLPEMTQDDAREWKAWVTGLAGKTGTFKLGDPGYFGPFGDVQNQGTVQFVPQPNTGFYLVGEGYQANTMIFQRGDMVEVGGELKIIVQDITTTDTGNALLLFMPRLHNTNQRGNNIIHDQPKGTFRLNQNLNRWDDQTIMTQLEFGISEAV